MDQIKISGLQVYAHHGVFKEENALGQKFIISAILYTNTRLAGKEDNLKESIHYGEVSHDIQNFLKDHTFKLIETVVEQLAHYLLLRYDKIKRIELEVEKPWAPIGLPLDSVAIRIAREWHTAYIALGSNMGDKEAYLNQGIAALKKNEDIRMDQVSSFITTKPYGVTDQDDFLNGCVKIQTLLTPRELLNCLQSMEQEAKRERIMRWGPRTLDLDILLYDDDIVEEEDLVIPHKEMHIRDFVLDPLMELAPRKTHPIYRKTIEELRRELDD